MFRLTLGAGFMSSNASSSLAGLSERVSGPSGTFSLVFGGALDEHWILGGDLWDMAAPQPTVSRQGVQGTAIDSTLGLGAIGVNVTYYLMPANVYFSLAPSLTRLQFTTGEIESSSKVGVGGKLQVGKEWWVGDHWGIGVAGQFAASENGDAGDTTWTTVAAHLLFTATYN
jgi:hypothetical protein